MKIMALEREVSTKAETFSPSILRAEARRLWELVQEDVVREVHFCGDRHTAVVLVECAGSEEAQQVLATLPLVEAGLITFELLLLVPYAGFARLFRNGEGAREVDREISISATPEL